MFPHLPADGWATAGGTGGAKHALQRACVPRLLLPLYLFLSISLSRNRRSRSSQRSQSSRLPLPLPLSLVARRRQRRAVPPPQLDRLAHQLAAAMCGRSA